MKYKIVLILTMLWSLALDLKGQENIKSSNPTLDVINKMVKSGNEYMNWWTYHYNTIKFGCDFIGLNVDSAIVNKAEFLTQLQSGEYLPFKLDSAENKPVYKLYELDSYDYEDISNTLMSQAKMALFNYNLEGKLFPAIEEKSLNGFSFDIENRKGKLTLFKTWFIGCKACIAEFPELNEMVESQKENENILFVSLATDNRDKLTTFLSKKPFSYEVIPNQQSLMDNLNIHAYPTHIIVDQDNKILKVCGSFEDLTAYIEESKIFEK